MTKLQKKSGYKTKKNIFILQNIHFKEILNSQTVTIFKKTRNVKTEEKGMKNSKLTLLKNSNNNQIKKK